ncbi:MAG TPA: AAA family ATPase [Candidatus Aquilonibacter sp.]|nr:AAA family ATPase [Candidatus Aquilonibacter sp.]
MDDASKNGVGKGALEAKVGTMAISERFIRAVEMDDLDAAAELLEAGVNPNIRNTHGEPVLHIAVANSNPAMVGLLLRYKALATARSRDGNSALRTAVSNNEKEIVDILFGSESYAGNLDFVVNDMLHGALHYRYMEMFNFLIGKVVNVNMPIADEEPLLAMALKMGDLATAEQLISKGADVNERFDHHENLLSFAVKQQNLKMVDLLVSHGADVNVSMHDYSDDTLMHWAVRKGSVDLIKILLKGKPKLDEENDRDETVLDVATDRGDKAVIDLLVENGVKPNTEGKKRRKAYNPIKITDCKFENVVGLERIKEELKRDVIYPLKHPQLASEYGIQMTGGILLYGPPGCGKTMVVKAIAGEMGINLIEAKVSDILEMWVGAEGKNMVKIFETARKNTPCIIFFDEIEMLGGKRTGNGMHPWLHEALTTFLTELDGVQSANNGVMVIGATNAPWMIDPALKRHGRLGKLIYIAPPQPIARGDIFRMYLKGRPISEAIDYAELAANTGMCTAADIRAVCTEALKFAWTRRVETERDGIVTQEDILRCIKKEKYNLGEWYAQTKAMVEGETNKRLYDDFVESVEAYEKANLQGNVTTSYR